MQDFNVSFSKYADLALRVGIHLKKGEGLVITANEHGLPLARVISNKAYALGAKHVELIFSDDAITRGRYENAADEVFDHFPPWKTDNLVAMYKDDCHHLFLSAPDPGLLKGIPDSVIARDQKTVSAAMDAAVRYRITGRTKWCIMAVSSPAWGKAVFPEFETESAVRLLWDKIFEATRVLEEDPVEAWQKHDVRLKKYKDFLNEKRFDKLLFTAPGTKLEVPLAKGHFWMGGSKNAMNGDAFVANIPTEEVFTTPWNTKVNGTLKATKPLLLNGSRIENFGFVFDEGKVVDFYAETGRETLSLLLENDAGSAYLGEVALVPCDSPISNTGLLFQNTLFDENASVHFALGRAYPYAMRNGSDLTPEELVSNGANFSHIHVDFMAGGPEMDITAIADDGSETPLFRNGNWCF